MKKSVSRFCDPKKMVPLVSLPYIKNLGFDIEHNDGDVVVMSIPNSDHFYLKRTGTRSYESGLIGMFEKHEKISEADNWKGAMDSMVKNILHAENRL